MKILFLSAWYPYPPSNGSKLRIYHLLRGLTSLYDVTLLSFTEQPETDGSDPDLRQMCDDVIVVPRKAFNPRRVNALPGFFSLTPRSVIDTFSPEMAHHIQRILSGAAFDLVIASQTMMAGYGKYFGSVPALFEEVEIAVLFEAYAHAGAFHQRLRHGLTWLKYRYYMNRLLRRFAACTVVSEQEQQLLAQVTNGNGRSIEIIPNGVDVAGYGDIDEEPQPNTLIFAGSFGYHVNYEAMVWFLREVYPLIQAQVPDVSLKVTGDHKNLPLPPAENMTLTGYVDDVRPLIAASWVSLAPILVGGGTRLKILEAMGLRSPVVSTSKGAEGLDAKPGEHLFVADAPEVFADAVVRLLRDSDLRARMVDNAYQLICEKYDWTAVMPKFLYLVEQVADKQNDLLAAGTP